MTTEAASQSIEASRESDARTIDASLLVAPSLLVISGGCLGLGAILHEGGAGHAGDVAWIVGGAIGAAYSLLTLIEGLRRGLGSRGHCQWPTLRTG